MDWVNLQWVSGPRKLTFGSPHQFLAKLVPEMSRAWGLRSSPFYWDTVIWGFPSRFKCEVISDWRDMEVHSLRTLFMYWTLHMLICQVLTHIEEPLAGLLPSYRGTRSHCQFEKAMWYVCPFLCLHFIRLSINPQSWVLPPSEPFRAIVCFEVLIPSHRKHYNWVNKNQCLEIGALLSLTSCWAKFWIFFKSKFGVFGIKSPLKMEENFTHSYPAFPQYQCSSHKHSCVWKKGK